MKRKLLIGMSVLSLWAQAFAGNPERAGQAGATQLLVNSWARSSGYNGINIGSASGIEAVMTNPAGIGTTKRTELVFAHTRYLVGTDINMNSFGLSQSLKKSGVIGLYVTSFDFGEIVRTTEDNPDGDLGTFSPSFMNIGLSYSKKFTDHIYVGTTVKLVSESIYDVGATGVCFDAGVQYRTNLGDDSLHNDKLKLGIALRNIGTTMRYSGDGLSFRADRAETFSSLSSRPSSAFEMPSVLCMGLSYDFYFGQAHRLTAMGSFISNAFAYDNIGGGVEYGFKQYFMLRYSFLYEKDITNDLLRRTVYTGHALGATVEIPFKVGKDKVSTFGLDYSYRTTNPLNGTHVLGARINL
jgi:hypothetical protein